MKFTGNLKLKVCEREGEGRNGHWKIASYLLETVEVYPKKMVVDVSDNQGRIAWWDEHVGKNVEVDFEVDAHEYNGRWFNSLKAWSLREAGGTKATAAGTAGPAGKAVGTTNGGPGGETPGTVNGTEGDGEGQSRSDTAAHPTEDKEAQAVAWDSMAQPAAKEPENDNLPF